MRSKFMTLLTVIGAVTVLVLAANSVVVAATGQSILLGKSNSANNITAITRTTDGSVLKLTNKSSVSPPFTVNGKGKVANLNADTLDGLNTAKFTKTYTATGTTPKVLVASVGGLQVYAGCLEDTDPIDHYADIEVRSTIAGATLTRSTTIGSSASTSYTPSFDVGDVESIAGTLVTGHSDLLYSTPAGAVVEAHIDWAGLAEAGANKCFLHGTLMGG